MASGRRLDLCAGCRLDLISAIRFFEWAAAPWAPRLQALEIVADSLFGLIPAVLGMAGRRSFEKAADRTR